MSGQDEAGALARLGAQYEGYPYPARDPRDEARRLIVGSPSHLDEIAHYVFAGAIDRSRPLKVLMAGGGTGDATVMLAQQAADAGVAVEIAYLDLSQASRAIAEARVRARNLASVTFFTGSLLDLGTPSCPPDLAARGPFDYIDCCGVLHHLPEPAAGLAALRRVLAPGGGMGIMVYAPYGRAGVYPLQDALRALADGLPDAERLALARRLLARLPATNGFRRNERLADHLASDAGLYDLLLHSRDLPFDAEALWDLVEGAGLAVAAFIEPARYDPATYLADPALLRRAQGLDRRARAALAERLSGDIAKHIVYLVEPARTETAVARPDRPEMIPVLNGIDGAAVARTLKPGQALEADLGGLALSLPLPRLAGPMLARIDGGRDLAALHREVAGLSSAPLDWASFKGQFDALYRALNGINRLLLRAP